MCSFLYSTKSIPNIEEANFYMKKRGPDVTNIVNHGKHIFLHNLLSLTGSFTPQPLVEDDVYVLFNGDIYNFLDLKNKYDLGNDIDNDTKCILPMYKKFGLDCFEHFDGEFSIVIVDYKQDVVLIGTDAFKCKPLWVSIGSDIGIASYESGLKLSGFENIKKFPPNSVHVYDLETGNVVYKDSIVKWDLNQYKETFDDWNAAFDTAIRKRTQFIGRGLFIGLSSGYDSGVIAASLNNQKIAYTSYSLIGTENQAIIDARVSINNMPYFYINKDGKTMYDAKQYLINNVEDYTYTIVSARSDYNEFWLKLIEDNGSSGLAAVNNLALQHDKRIMLSGSGADEIYSDYGFGGHSKYKHSNFGGLFPEDLKTIFPKDPEDLTCIWRSFYGSSMESYLAKEEYVNGNRGLSSRYPFMDKELVQEFLSLSVKLKNSVYKSPIYNYLSKYNYPLGYNEKIGF